MTGGERGSCTAVTVGTRGVQTTLLPHPRFRGCHVPVSSNIFMWYIMCLASAVAASAVKRSCLQHIRARTQSDMQTHEGSI